MEGLQLRSDVIGHQEITGPAGEGQSGGAHRMGEGSLGKGPATGLGGKPDKLVGLTTRERAQCPPEQLPVATSSLHSFLP